MGPGGKLTVLDKELQVLKTFDGTISGVRSLAGNDNFIAYGVDNGKVLYYNRDGGLTPKVSEILNFEYYSQMLK